MRWAGVSALNLAILCAATSSIVLVGSNAVDQYRQRAQQQTPYHLETGVQIPLPEKDGNGRPIGEVRYVLFMP